MEKYFSWAITKMFRNNIFITILFPRLLTCNRNARNARLLWKTNGTYCTHLIEGQVKIRSIHCKSNCNKNSHIYHALLFISTHTFKLKQNKMKKIFVNGFSSDCIGVIYIVSVYQSKREAVFILILFFFYLFESEYLWID